MEGETSSLNGSISGDAEMTSRIRSLESLSVEQQREISQLRADLDGIIARVMELENPKSSQTTKKSTVDSSRSSSSVLRNQSVEPRTRPKLGGQSSASLPGKRLPSQKPNASRTQPAYSKTDGSLRFYLKGRPIPVYLPSDQVESYDMSSSIAAPEDKLALEWIYGYRGRDCRDNLFLLPTGELAYFVAAVVVLFNVDEHTQRHYRGHVDDIRSMAISPDGVTVATGQAAGHHSEDGKAHVRVWSSVGLETLKVFGKDEFEGAVICLGFSKADGGDLLGAVDDSARHVVTVWDWKKGKKLARLQDSGDPTLVLAFNPIANDKFVTCGKGHISFWTLAGNKLAKKSGVFGGLEKPKVIICLLFAEDGTLLTGDSSGHILVWPHGKCQADRALDGAHEGGVFSLFFKRNGHLLSGGKDSRIFEWDTNYARTEFSAEVPKIHGSVRTLAEGANGELFVGTTHNSILQADAQFAFSVVVEGHFEELWGLAVHPSLHQFLTASDDGYVVLWDSVAHRNLWSTSVGHAVKCASFYPTKGDASISPLAALGTSAGKWLVLDLTTRKVIAVHSDASEESITCIAYSPDGELVALGARDNYVYVYKVMENGQRYSRVGRCAGHSSSVLHLDWSEDGQVIRTQSADHQVNYWSSSDCKQMVSPSALRDVGWSSHEVTLAWDTIGIWRSDYDGTDVNACTQSHAKKLIAFGDDFGMVCLMQYPASVPKTERHEYNGHSAHVTNVEFTFDDSRIVTTGGGDTAVIQWQHA